jgi:hypothetical protein
MGNGIVRIGGCVMFAAFLGCGSGSPSGAGGTTFTTSVSGSKPLNTLTTSDKAQLCADVVRYESSSDFARAQCKSSGVLTASLLASFEPSLSDTDLRAACTQTYDACLSSAADAGSSGAGSMGMCDSSVSIPADCVATVAEYSACVSDLPSLVGGSFPECSALTRASLNTDAGTVDVSGTPNTPACNTFSAKCPGAFGSTGGSDGGTG